MRADADLSQRQVDIVGDNEQTVHIDLETLRELRDDLAGQVHEGCGFHQCDRRFLHKHLGEMETAPSWTETDPSVCRENIADPPSKVVPGQGVFLSRIPEEDDNCGGVWQLTVQEWGVPQASFSMGTRPSK